MYQHKKHRREEHQRITFRQWGEHQGFPVYLFRIVNGSGAAVELTNYGATVVSILVPDGDGELGNVVLGYSSFQGYQQDHSYIGSTIGRYANRISQAKFTLSGTEYRLEANDGPNSNHSGGAGFHARVFSYALLPDGIAFTLFSPDGEGGFPGNLDLKVIYRWTEANELLITYQSLSDQQTIVNITNHAYFNLSEERDKILDHRLTVFADNLLETDSDFIPTGRLRPVLDLNLDNSTLRSKMLAEKGRLIGLNYCYLLHKDDRQVFRPAAELTDLMSKRKLEVFTTYPSLMVYTADKLSSEYPGCQMRCYEPFDGICLECQYYPDSPNRENFPSTVLEPGKVHEERIVYSFSTLST